MEQLNERQLQAVLSVQGPLLILAGAGSGKTKTITHRIAHMITQMGIAPESILALSFTNKAASEMLQRVRLMIPASKRKGLSLCTFHALGLQILKKEIHHLGYHPRFTLYDTADQMSILRYGLRQYRGGKNFDRKILHSQIGQLKNKNISAENYLKSSAYDPSDDYCVALEFLYPYYQEKLKFYNALDFDDILFKTLQLFDQKPELAKAYSQKFQYLMIDEYQDTNPLQFQIIKHLTSTHHNICVVGDDDQAIYGFRGADIQNILNFEQHFPKTKIIKLEENYRSTQKILSLANEVIKKNKKRKEKTMWSQKDHAQLPYLWQAADATHEAQLICDEINRLQNQGLHLSEICVLYRSNTQSPVMEDELRMAQIPYQIIGGQKFYERKEIKDIIAYLCLIQNQNDELSLRRVLNVPNRGIGAKTLENYLEQREKNPQSLFKILTWPALEHQKNVPAFTELIHKYQKRFSETSLLTPVVEELLAEIGFYQFVQKSYQNQKQLAAKLALIDQFLDSVRRFDQQTEFDHTLDQFIAKILLADSQDQQRPSKDQDGQVNQVTLMTLHASKGLEFEAVFLTGLEEELLPHKKCLLSADELSEERRLAYVGITRAKTHLVMTYCKERLIYNKMSPRKLSRFLKDQEDFYVHQDRTTLGHMSEEESKEYTASVFRDLLKSID